jgi:hypothetical protein
VGVDEIDLPQIPAGVADAELAEMTVAAGDLEASAGQRDRPITAPLGARDLGAKGAAQLVAGRAGRPTSGPAR